MGENKDDYNKNTGSEKNGENKDSSKKIAELEKNADEQANTIAKLENDIKKLGDPNKSPKIIQKGNQKHPKYEKNNKKIAATLPKENLEPKSK